MKIEIKNIKVNESFSEETTCFTADIFVNGKKIGYARNDGQGRSTDYDFYHESNNKEVFRQAEAYAKTLPKVPNPYGEPFDNNLEWVIDLAIDEYRLAKAKKQNQAKLLRHMQIGICYGKPNELNYTTVGWEKRTLKETANLNFKMVQDKLDDIRKNLPNGEVILNTNLAELGLK